MNYRINTGMLNLFGLNLNKVRAINDPFAATEQINLFKNIKLWQKTSY